MHECVDHYVVARDEAKKWAERCRALEEEKRRAEGVGRTKRVWGGEKMGEVWKKQGEFVWVRVEEREWVGRLVGKWKGRVKRYWGEAREKGKRGGEALRRGDA